MSRSIRVAIVDYRAGNLRSVANALETVGANPVITASSDEIERADALVFPGQGSNDSSMRALGDRNLIEPIKKYIDAHRPFLGVCLGLQLLFEGSDEGVEPGLGVARGWVKKFPDGQKIPHIGWNSVTFQDSHEVLSGIPDGSYFYFAHSYYADPRDEQFVAGTTEYGVKFCSAIARNNLVAVQFHPEKSGDLGLKIYDRFITLARGS